MLSRFTHSFVSRHSSSSRVEPYARTLGTSTKVRRKSACSDSKRMCIYNEYARHTAIVRFETLLLSRKSWKLSLLLSYFMMVINNVNIRYRSNERRVCTIVPSILVMLFVLIFLKYVILTAVFIAVLVRVVRGPWRALAVLLATTLHCQTQTTIEQPSNDWLLHSRATSNVATSLPSLDRTSLRPPTDRYDGHCVLGAGARPTVPFDLFSPLLSMLWFSSR